MTGPDPPRDAGRPPQGPGVIRFGVGGAARRAAADCADRLWESGVAARAVFRPEYGGWAVVVFAQRPRPAPHPRP